jgi:hypothetical protein
MTVHPSPILGLEDRTLTALADGQVDVAGPYMPRRQRLDTGRCRMKAIVVNDQAAGTAGMRVKGKTIIRVRP